MAERKRPRVTPRNSEMIDIADRSEVVTPFQLLHQLGRSALPRTQYLEDVPDNITPVQRQLSAAAQKRVDVHTPTIHPTSPTNLTPAQGILSTSRRINTPGTSNNKAMPGGGRRLKGPTTPHGIRAQQINDRKRFAGATPAPGRRRSGKTYRDTPRNDLQALSRLLATKTAPIPTSPASGATQRTIQRSKSRQPDSESPPPTPPRMSLSRKELDYDSFHEPAPRMSVGPEDDELEEGRRQYQRRRSTFGEQRLFDQMDVLDELDDEDPLDQAVGDIIQDVFGEEEEEDDEFTGQLGDNTTRNLRAMMREEAEGDITRHSFGTDGEPTFQFNVGEGDYSRLSQSFAQQQEAARTGRLSFADIEPVQDDQDDQAQDLTVPQIESDADVPAIQDYEDDDDDNNAAFDEQSVTASPRPVSSPQSIARVAQALAQRETTRQPRVKPKHVSKHGIEYPSLPGIVIKKLASTFSRQSGGNGKINKETLGALNEASDWFFERMSEDLATYSTHAKRKRIEEADVVTLMKRQRLLNDHHTVFSLAQKYLPGELLQAVRMAPPITKSRGKKRRLSVVEEEE